MTKIKIEFKESYMPHSVVRECINMTRDEVIKIYDLNGGDIEWFRFLEY